jgi:DNA-binding MarR family transcriptional regulator
MGQAMEEQKIKNLREKLRQLDRATGGVFDSQQECCGLTTAQCHTLLEIGGKAPVSLIELADGLGLDSSTLSRTIQGLVVLGLVSRQPSERDRRYVDISLTNEGRKAFDRIESINKAIFSRVLESLPPGRRDSILEGIGLFVDAVLKQNLSGCSLEVNEDES